MRDFDNDKKRNKEEKILIQIREKEEKKRQINQEIMELRKSLNENEKKVYDKMYHDSIFNEEKIFSWRDFLDTKV